MYKSFPFLYSEHTMKTLQTDHIRTKTFSEGITKFYYTIYFCSKI